MHKRITVPIISTAFMGAVSYANPVEVAIPVYVQIAKSTPSEGLAIRAEHFNFQATYRNDRFDDVVMSFDVVQLDPVITQYQMNIQDLSHYCDSDPITTQTYLDGTLIAQGDTVSGLNFTHTDGTNGFRPHQTIIEFSAITQKVAEQACSGMFVLSVQEQI